MKFNDAPNISVAELLKIKGEWTKGKDFAEFVSEKLEVSSRHAYTLIKKAADKKEILRILLPDRTVIYGLPKFGSSAEAFTSQSKNIYPKMSYEVTQRITIDFQNGIYMPPSYDRRLPTVGFNIINQNEFPIKARIRIRMILGGKDKGLIPDPQGYYNGKTALPFDPVPDGLQNGSFSVLKQCADTDKKLTLQVSILATDPSGGTHALSPKSWTYNRKENCWFLEPKTFFEEQWPQTTQQTN